MKTSLRILAAAGLLAGSAAIALAQPAPPPAGPMGQGAPCANCPAGGPGMQAHRGMGMGMGMDPTQMHAQMQERMQARMDALKAQLKLSPAQQPAWDALDAKLKAQAEARRAQLTEMQAVRGDAQKMLEFRAETMKRNGERLSEIAAARAALVAQLTPEQKTMLDKARTDFAGEYGHGKRQNCGKKG